MKRDELLSQVVDGLLKVENMPVMSLFDAVQFTLYG